MNYLAIYKNLIHDRSLIRDLFKIINEKISALFTRSNSEVGYNKPIARDVFSIAIYKGSSPLRLEPFLGNGRTVLSRSDVTDVDAVYVADPFMILYEQVWHMFFEILSRSTSKGIIGLATSSDGCVWKYCQVVLEEDFHLSYPYVFKHGQDYFMIPESNEDLSVRLYKASEFPMRWDYVGNLLEGEALVDCSPFYFNDRWWLFAGCGDLPCRADTLRLFHADEMMGTWQEHPASPIITDDPTIARPCGRVVLCDGYLLRFAQDCHPYYGQRVRAFVIMELTLTSYIERPASHDPILRESHQGWNECGMHHMDAHQLPDGKWLACVDGWKWENQ